MNFRTILLAAAAVAALAGPLAAPAAAQEFGNTLNPQFQGDRESRARTMSARQVVAMLASRLRDGGQAIAVSPLQYAGETPYYEVEWRTPDGRSRTLRVNAVSGNLM